MAWKFAPFVVATDYVADIDTVNENFLAVIGEVTGALNEHNFDRIGFDDRTLWDESIALKVTHVKSDFSTTTPNSDAVDITVGWHPIHEDFDATVTTKCRKLWIIASFQCNIAAQYGALLGIDLDGTVLGESIIGSGDHSNDQMDDYGFVSGGGAGAYGFTFGSTPGVFRAMDSAGYVSTLTGAPFVLDAVVDVTPGTHVIKPSICILKADDGDSVTLKDYDLVVIEMW
jgi:hypothetical protein